MEAQAAEEEKLKKQWKHLRELSQVDKIDKTMKKAGAKQNGIDLFESSSNGKRDKDEEDMMGDGDDLETDLGETKKKTSKKATKSKKNYKASKISSKP